MKLLSRLVAFSGPLGAYQLARHITKKQPRILMYHRFSASRRRDFTSAKAFEAQVAHIKKYYVPMTVVEIAEALFEDKPLPEHAVAITVDDGYRDFFDIGFPILKKYNVPATFYVTTGFITGSLWLWPDQVSWLVNNAPETSRAFQNGSLKIEGPYSGEHAGLWKKIISFLLTVSDECKHELISALAAHWDLELPSDAPKHFAAASWSQLEEMQDAGIEIGGHTVTHPSLGQVSANAAVSEIEGCKRDLDEHLGVRSRSFCYPNGTPSDYSPELEDAVKKAHFSAAVVAFADSVGMKARFSLRRHSSGEGRFQFDKAVSGVELLGHCVRARALF